MNHVQRSPALPTPIAPNEARFIRLGPSGSWAKHCFDTNTIRFGSPTEPHDFCLAGDWDGVARAVGVPGRNASDVSNALREFRDFYTLDESCLWITFAGGQLWWTFAKPGVVDLRGKANEPGIVARQATGWRDTDLRGEPLHMERLSSQLTKTSGYRRTICKVADFDALCRVINGEEHPAVTRARDAEAALVEATAALIARLHQNDFERFADLILAQLGWRRVSQVGGSLADVDLLIEQPATGERAFVQVKSAADQAVLDDYLQRFESGRCDRMFFLCHSPTRQLEGQGSKPVHVWTGAILARHAVRAGLVDWLIDSTR